MCLSVVHKMKAIAIIPVRGGSVGIPRKNMRLMNGRPLLYYIIKTATECPLISDVVVTTDDEEIKGYVQSFSSAKIVDRDYRLAGSEVPLDPVVYDALIRTEQENAIAYDIVITLQATSPLLKTSTLEMAINSFLSSNLDTMISVSNNPHLAWHNNYGKVCPLYEKRVNRQYLPSHYAETGAFLITKRDCIDKSKRIGQAVAVYEIGNDEAIDIDDPLDWVQCEAVFRRKKIVFRVDAHMLLGMGHIYNCLTLAYNMTEHVIMFVCDAKYDLGIEKVKLSKFPLTIVRSDYEFYKFLEQYEADIIVIDQLDTEAEFIKKLKRLAHRVVTIEDRGSGIYHADAVINALYEEKHHLEHVYSGKDYICLRDEFLIETPKPFSPQVRDVFVMFGGTDPLNLTKKLYDMALHFSKDSHITFTFAAGMAYDYEANGINESACSKILIFQDAKRISRYMKQADIAFISQGRSVYEIASLGVPAIVLSHNERERTHTFAHMENGFLNLGMGTSVTEETLLKTFTWLVQTPQIRAEMRRLQLQNDLKTGVERVKRVILGD